MLLPLYPNRMKLTIDFKPVIKNIICLQKRTSCFIQITVVFLVDPKNEQLSSTINLISSDSIQNPMPLKDLDTFSFISVCKWFLLFPPLLYYDLISIGIFLFSFNCHSWASLFLSGWSVFYNHSSALFTFFFLALPVIINR